MNPNAPAVLTSETKFWVITELFVIPLPLIVRVSTELLMVKGLAPALNTMLLTSVVAERETAGILETLKVAICVGPLGTVGGVQFAAIFQLPVVGLSFQVALPPLALIAKDK